MTPPYTVQWPAPMHQITDPIGLSAVGTPNKRSSSRSSSLECVPGDPFVPSAGSLLAQQQLELSVSLGGTNASPPMSPQHSEHQRSSSRQGSITVPQPGPLIRDVPQPPRTAFNVPSAIAAPHPHSASWGQGQGQGAPVHLHIPHTPTLSQMTSLHRQGSQHTTHQHQPSSAHQHASLTHLSHNHSGHPHPSTTHHISRPRSRSRPPSAASHRYASSITPQVYGHGSSATLNTSRTSLNGGASSRANPHATSPPHGISPSHHPGTGSVHMPSEPAHRSRLHTRVPPFNTHGTPTTPHSAHKLKDPPPSAPVPMPAAHMLRRTVHRPALPAGYDGLTQTRYVRMLLALDEISPLFNVLASFFTWVLLAGFVLFPGTFASWKDVPTGSPQGDILSVINHVSLWVHSLNNIPVIDVSLNEGLSLLLFAPASGYAGCVGCGGDGKKTMSGLLIVFSCK